MFVTGCGGLGNSARLEIYRHGVGLTNQDGLQIDFDPKGMVGGCCAVLMKMRLVLCSGTGLYIPGNEQ